MSTPFRIQIVNARGDDDQLFVLLQAKSSTGVDGIVPGISTAFQSLNESKTVTMATVDSGRLYVGYGSFTVPPKPGGDQYYGWIEFSRMADDSQVWINLSNVDLVGLPLTLQGQAGGKPFSLGYKVAKNGIVDQLKAVAGKVAVVTCRSGQTKILGPTIQPQAYRSFRNYRESLAAGKAAMSITSDPIGQDRKVFTGTMQPDDPIIDLKSEDGISFQVNGACQRL